MALANISINDDNLLLSLQKSILEQTNRAAQFSATFSNKPLESSLDNAGGGNANYVTNYGGYGVPMEEIDAMAMAQRGELANIAGDERRKFENALRMQRWDESQSGRLRRLLDHNSLQKHRVLQQSDTYPVGLKRVGTIKGLKHLLQKKALDFTYPTNPILYGVAEAIGGKRPAVKAADIVPDNTIYLPPLPAPDVPPAPQPPAGGIDPNVGFIQRPLPQPPQQNQQQQQPGDLLPLDGPNNADNFFAGDEFEPATGQDITQRQFVSAEMDRGFPRPPTQYLTDTPALDSITPVEDDQLNLTEEAADNSMNKYWNEGNLGDIYRLFGIFDNTRWLRQCIDFAEWFVSPHTAFPNENEVQIIMYDTGEDGLRFGDVLVDSQPTRENIYTAFQTIAQREDLQLMPISKYMGSTLPTFEAFMEQYDLDNANTFGGDESISELIFCKYMVSNFNLYYHNLGHSEDELIFFRHPTAQTRIAETRSLVSADPTTSLIEIFQAFKEIDDSGVLNENLQNARFDDNRWTIFYEKLSLFESVIGEQMNRLATLIFRNYTYRLINEPFTNERESYANILKKMLSAQNKNKLMWELNTPKNTASFNEIISLAALFDCFVTSTSFPPSLNELPRGMTRMISNDFLTGAMVSLHETEPLFIATRLRNFMLMYTAILSGTYYFGFVDDKTGDYDKLPSNRPMTDIKLILSGQDAMLEFANNLNPANLLTEDMTSLQYNALSDFIDRGKSPLPS